jgi:ATP-dependent helicase/nuclease subunit B
MTLHAPRLFNIPPSAPFLPTLVGALVDGRLVDGFPASRDPLALAEATLYLPTRRACRLAQDVFWQVLGTDAAILPRIVPVGDIDEDEIVFADIAAGALAQEALSLPRAMDNFERKAWLTQLILAWAKSRGMKSDDDASLIANSPSAAFTMAGELARLQDDMITREVPWSRLDRLVPREMDPYFQVTLDFLKIIRDVWPSLLNERQMIDIAARRDRLIDAETARLQRPGGGPVIAAGSTASMPSTAKLLATIAHLPNGAVVLPGVDTDLDMRAFDMIAGSKDHAPAPSHPQYAMQAFLRRLQATRDIVIELAPRAAHGREAIVSEAMRPAEATESWQERLNDLFFEAKKQSSLGGLTLIGKRWHAGKRDTHRRLDHPGSRFGAARACGAGALECAGGRFGRRCACRYTSRIVCAARCGNGIARLRAGDIAGIAETSALPLEQRGVFTSARGLRP